MPSRTLGLIAILVVGTANTASAQVNYTFKPSAPTADWTTGFNWSPADVEGNPVSNVNYPGRPFTGVGNIGSTVFDVAVVGNHSLTGGLLINFAAVGGAGLDVGSVQFNASSSGIPLTIGNSSGTNGVLRLNGLVTTPTTVAQRTLLSVTGSSDLTLANAIGGPGTQTMEVRLGITNGIFNAAAGRTLTIGSNVTEQTANSNLTIQGGGTVVFTGSNSYGGTTGTTTISAGTLQVGSGGTTGTLGGGSVTNNAALVFNRGNSLTVSNNISGSGTVTKQGNGTTTLTGTNTYSGTTTISAGILQVGSGGGTGTLGGGGVTNDAALTFNRNNALTVSDAISGNGSVTQLGAGVTTLTGTNTYGGTTTVSGGTLRVNGNSGGATGDVGIGTGAILDGTGTVGGAVTVNGGGRLEAGNSVGTLAVNNNVTVNSNGTLRAEIGAGSSSDKLNMTSGSQFINLQNGSTVSLVNSGFDATLATTYTLADLGTGDVQVEGSTVAPGTAISYFRFNGNGNNGTFHTVTGSVNILVSGFDTANGGLGMSAGDRLTLRREAGTGDLVVVFTPVPEPGTVLAVCGLAAGGVAGWRRWRRKSVEVTPAA